MLERCESKGITLKLEKSAYFTKKLKCYGYMFSKNSMKTQTQRRWGTDGDQNNRTTKSFQQTISICYYQVLCILLNKQEEII